MIWNKYKRKFISFKGVNYIDKYNAKKYNNEYLQAVLQGYEFTIIDHIYEKNNKNYYYNNKTLKFDEILLDLKCQRKGDKINYPELSDEEAFDKIYKEMELSETLQRLFIPKIIQNRIPITLCQDVIIHGINIMFGIIIKEK